MQGRARGKAWLEGQAKGKRPDLNSPETIRESEEEHEVYQSLFSSLDAIGIPIIVIPVNMDAPESHFFSHLFHYEKTLNNIRLVQENIFYYEGFFFSGFGGEITKDQLEKDFVLQYPVQKARFFI